MRTVLVLTAASIVVILDLLIDVVHLRPQPHEGHC